MTVRKTRLNREIIEVTTFDEIQPDWAHWLAQTPAQRLEALEHLRQIHYGYDPAERMKREIVVLDA